MDWKENGDCGEIFTVGPKGNVFGSISHRLYETTRLQCFQTLHGNRKLLPADKTGHLVAYILLRS